jgi:hypothetical protein
MLSRNAGFKSRWLHIAANRLAANRPQGYRILISRSSFLPLLYRFAVPSVLSFLITGLNFYVDLIHAGKMTGSALAESTPFAIRYPGCETTVLRRVS